MSIATLCNLTLTLKRLASEGVDAGGAPVERWVDVATRAGRIAQMSAREQAIRGQIGVVATHKCWWKPTAAATEAKAGDMIELKGTGDEGRYTRLFRVASVNDVHNMRRLIVLELEEISGDTLSLA